LVESVTELPSALYVGMFQVLPVKVISTLLLEA